MFSIWQKDWTNPAESGRIIRSRNQQTSTNRTNPFSLFLTNRKFVFTKNNKKKMYSIDGRHVKKCKSGRRTKLQSVAQKKSINIGVVVVKSVESEVAEMIITCFHPSIPKINIFQSVSKPGSTIRFQSNIITSDLETWMNGPAAETPIAIGVLN